jgi:TonB-linked SusC/RagA family outer membrane protein
MRKLLQAFAITLALGMAASEASAQLTGAIAGQVVDQATRQALAGAQVFVAGTNISTLSDQRGRYLLVNVPVGQQTVRTVIIGYAPGEATVTVAAGETVTADFDIRVSAVALDELVVNAVTGRLERKRELGTNTATISSNEIARAPITKLADVLTARAAGVQLQAAGGTVGTSQRIRIRGANSISLSNEPLIFLDGVMFSNSKGGYGVGGQDYSRLNDLNSDDIANIEILKGPAASALYGTAAANGVILITTKRGHTGTAQWRAYVEGGISEDKNPYRLNYLAYQVNNASAPLFTARGNLNSAGYAFCPNESAARGICTQQQILALNPFTTEGLTPLTKGDRRKAGISVAGGGEDVTYFVSGDFDREEGVISFNDQTRLNLRANLGARMSDKLSLNITTGYTKTGLWLNANDNNIFSPMINALLATPFVPDSAQRAATGPGQRAGTGFGYFLSDIEEILTRQEIDRFVVGASASFNPISWLAINGNVGMDYFGRDDGVTVQPGRLPIAATYTPGFRDAQKVTNYIWTTNLAGVATFQLTDQVGSTTTLGGGFSRELLESTSCYGVGIVEGTRSCAATSSLFEVDEGYNEVRTIGGYLQQQLNWRDRVILSGSVRGDDNSAFGVDYGFIYYPGVSLSWVASEEDFFPDINFLTNLRLRAAYGKSGQRPNFRDAVTLFEPVSATSNNQELSAVRLARIGNRSLKPERTTEWEAGFDVGVLDDRLSLEFTYFNKESQDALISRPLPPSFGLTGDAGATGTIFDNLGSIKNWGTEIAMNARVLNYEDAIMNLRLSATTLDNRIEDLGENIQPIIFNRGNQQHKQGFPTGAFFGRRYEIADPDNQRLLARNDVSIIDTDSAVFLGRFLPSNSQSLSTDLTLFGNVTVTALFERRAGHKQLNYTEYFRCVTGYNRGAANAAGGQCEGVSDPNASNFEQARFIASRFLNTQVGYVEDADFIKWRELAVTVAMPQNVLGGPATLAQGGGGSSIRRLLQGASVTFSGRNLKTWTDYTGLDPEINESGGGANFTQGEFNTQPPLRYYQIRLNFAF